MGVVRSLALAGSLTAVISCAPWRDDQRSWATEAPRIASELQTHARPLSAIDGSAAMADEVWAMTRDARVIGIGEGTHGTREFHLLLHAMLQRAAQEDRPLALALETPFDWSLRFNAWVGAGAYPEDPNLRDQSVRELLGDGGLWGIAANYALFEWIRAWNDEAAPGREIHVYGVDVCMSRGCGTQLAAWITDVAPERRADVERLLQPLQELTLERTRSLELATRARANLVRLRQILETTRAKMIERHGVTAFAAAKRLIWLAERRVDIALAFGLEPVSAERERAMADTVMWIADTIGPGGQLLVYAHNGHVGRANDRMPNGRFDSGPVMGKEVAARLGDDYKVVYTTFDAGSFRAYHTRSWIGAESFRVRETRAFPVKPAPAGTLEATLRSAGPYALDVRRAMAHGGALARYFEQPHWSRSYTYAWRASFGLVPVAWTGVVAARDFDVLVYFPRASASRVSGSS